MRADQTEHGGDAGDRQHHAGEGQRAGASPGGRPQPAHHEDRRGVFEQQCDADREVCDGVVVEQLRSGDGNQTVGDDRAQVVACLAQPAGMCDGGERGHRQRTAGQSGGDRGRRAPARGHQSFAERTRTAEGKRRGNREEEAATEPRARRQHGHGCTSTGLICDDMSKLNFGRDATAGRSHESNDFQS